MIHAIVMAGGKGTRFWPLSRSSRPKQFLTMLGHSTLLDQTIVRLAPYIPAAQVWVVGSKGHEAFLEPLKEKFPGCHVLYEPMGKNTAACIGWAAIELLKQDPDAVMVVLPADHYIEPASAFRKVIEEAVMIASTEDRGVTIGIHPAYAHTGYGYIEVGDTHHRVSQVKSFCEKPDEKTAKKYLKTGRYFWNSGIFVWKAKKILSLFQEHLPAHFNLLEKIAQIDSADTVALATIFKEFESVSIDYGIMEKATTDISMISANFLWSDIGNWTAIDSFLSQDDNKNAHNGEIITINSENNLVYSEKRLVTLVDVHDFIVIDSEDALLILPKRSDQKIRDLVAKLPEKYK